MAFLKDVNIYDVIVVGVGSMGASACYYLAAAGLKVLGLEQFTIPHERGSHTGESRFVRMAYFEHPDYVPLLKRAYENWDHIEKLSGEHLFHKSGLVYFGLNGCELMQGVRASARLYDLPIEEVNKIDSNNRYPQFTLPSDYQTIYEENAGFVLPEKTIETYMKCARLRGAEILENTCLKEWEKSSSGIICKTSKGIFRAKKIIFTAGGWTQNLIPDLKHELQVTQQSLVWFKPKDIEHYKEDNFSCWSVTDPAYDGMFYGFPIFDAGNPTMKMAYHSRGIEKSASKKTNEVTSQELDPMRFFLSKYMHDLKGEISYTKTCLYNYSKDEDFIIDTLPGYDDAVVIACGFSGHGFKFVPMVGEVLKDLVTKGKSSLPIDFLKIR